MNTNDLIGFCGVFILLVAFFLNITGKLDQKNPWYSVLNILGAGIACLASVLIHYTPFILLEGSWALVSIWGLIRLKTEKPRT